jgi:hypothetical protein
VSTGSHVTSIVEVEVGVATMFRGVSGAARTKPVKSKLKLVRT